LAIRKDLVIMGSREGEIIINGGMIRTTIETRKLKTK
jgi:hypothetical protein